jgi:predicted nucleic acid-binding Zn ribbon protein
MIKEKMKRAGEVLSAFFDERLMKKVRGYSKLFTSWAELTEKNGIAAAAAHSRIRELDRGILQIEADHPGWIQILQTKESKLLNDFQRRFPEQDISGISLMLSRPGPPPEYLTKE